MEDKNSGLELWLASGTPQSARKQFLGPTPSFQVNRLGIGMRRCLSHHFLGEANALVPEQLFENR